MMLGWATLVLIYFVIEALRLVRLVRRRNHLHASRTPLSEGFDRRSWGEWMAGRLKREAEMGPDFVRQLLSSLFYAVDPSCLTRGDIDRLLRMYLSAAERPGPDGPLEPWAKALADESRAVVERSLGYTFPPGEARHPFSRINHPAIDNNPIGTMLRPLPLVAGFLLTRTLGDLWLRCGLGFVRWVDEPTGFVFWRHQRPGRAPDRVRKAVIFISGFGQGQSLYPHHAWCLVHDADFASTYSDVCLCELPGVSGVPMRSSDGAYPSARETVQAFERFASQVLDLQTLDAIAHSGGGFPLAYASRFAPSLFAKSVYAEVPVVFFTHSSKSYPFLFAPFTLGRLARNLLDLDFTAIANWVVMSEVSSQHVIKNSTWFMECCHREEPSALGRRAMLILGTADQYVDGKATAAYFAKHHPDVWVHLIEGWAHGAFWDPRNTSTVIAMLRAYLCDEQPSVRRAEYGSINAVASEPLTLAVAQDS